MAMVEEVWGMIHVLLAAKFPTVNDAFREGASEEEIQKLEDTIGTQLPEDFKNTYRIHNGHTGNGPIFEAHRFSSVDEIITDWTNNKDLEEGLDEEAAKDTMLKIQPKWVDRRWIPFACSCCGDSVMLDLAPAPEGTVGQVFLWYHDSDEKYLLAANFTEYLEKFATDLESGKYELCTYFENSLFNAEYD